MKPSVVLAGILCVAVGCRSADRRSSEIDPRPFTSFAGTAILCFDLRGDVGLTGGGLLLRVGPSAASGRRDVILPFRTRTVTPSRNVLLASGSYDEFTVLSMSIGAPSLGASAVSFVPHPTGIDVARPSIDGLEPGLYYQESGLERWFVFVDGAESIIDKLRRDFPATTFETYDAIAVAIPEGAEGREVKKGNTVDPPPNQRFGNVMLFAKSSVTAARRVAIRYVVPPTPAQLAASNTGLKLVLVLLVPIFTLLFIDPEDIQRPKLRVIAIWGGVALQALFVGAVLWAAFVIRKPSADAWGDFAIGALGVISEVIVILVKTKPPRKAA